MAVTSSTVAAQTAPRWAWEVESRTTVLVADAWDIPPEEVFLQWGSYSGPIPTAQTPIMLLGIGAGGEWVLRLGHPNGATAWVKLTAGRRVTRAFAARRLRPGETLDRASIEVVASIVWGEPDGEESIGAGWRVEKGVERGAELRGSAVLPPIAVRARQTPRTARQAGGGR